MGQPLPQSPKKWGALIRRSVVCCTPAPAPAPLSLRDDRVEGATTELTAVGEPRVRISRPPAVSPLRTTGSGATFAMGRVARREMILRSKRYPRVDRGVGSIGAGHGLT